MNASEIVLSPSQVDAARSLCVGGGQSERALLDEFGYRTLTTLTRLRVVDVRRAGGLPALYHLTEFGRELLCAQANDDTEQGGTTMTSTDLATVKPDPKTPRKPAAEKKTAKTATKTEPAAAAEVESTEAAVPPIENVTGKPPEPKTAAQKNPLPATVEKKVIDAVTGVVPADHDFYKQAVRYGRKIAKKQRGLRASNPPLAGLSKETAAKVEEAVLAALGA